VDRGLASRIPFLNIVCYKWGTLYPSQEVNILRAMVRRNLTLPHSFHCITDDPAGLGDDIEIHPLPDYGFQGNWRKLYTFSRDFLGLEGQFAVSLDIDIVIVGNIDFLADDPEKSFVIARQSWSQNVRGHGAIYRVRVGSHTALWEDFVSDPKEAIARHASSPSGLHGEQNWFERKFETMEHFPQGKIISFKYHCEARSFKVFGRRGARIGLTTAHFGSARLPEDAAIVSFQHGPLPRDVQHKRYFHWKQAPFVAQHWRA
jgi:hypothetical protein